MSSRHLVVASVLVALLAVGCGGKKKSVTAADFTATATFERGMDQLREHDLRQAIASLKRIQFTPDIREEIEPLARLAVADATFYQGTTLSVIDARNLYLDFVTLNGDHPLAPYAQLQAGLCSLEQVNHPTKDQTETVQAIRDLQLVENRWPDSSYVIASRSLLIEARSNLAESEFLVGQFYLNRKAYAAAIQRFSKIVDEFPDFEEMEKVLYHLGVAHLKAGNDAEGRLYMDKLITDYPMGSYSDPARKALADASASG